MDISIWVVIVLVLLSGAVAAVGDWLGRRLGKKRLRFGKLRPKHTAIATTFVAGMLITALTIVILSLMSEQVRKWLIEGANVQMQLKEARDDLAIADQQLKSGRDDIAKVRLDLETERKKLEEEQRKVEQATKDAESLRADAAALKTQVARLGKQLEDSSARLDQLQAQYGALERNRDILQGNIQEFTKQQDELFQKNNELLAQNEQYLEDIGRLERQISGLNASVTQSQEALRIAEENYQKETTRINAERTRALADLNAAKTDLQQAQRELNELRQSKFLLESNSTRARFNRLIYNRGDELARLSVRSMLTQAEARSSLLAAIELASRDALSRGASESRTSSSAAGFPTLSDENGNPITPEMQFQRAVELLSGRQVEHLLVVRALANSFVEDWVWITVETVPNSLVYNQGDFLIETRVDGRRGVQFVTEAIVTFLATQLRDRAVRDGMVPAIGRPTELGEITQEQLQQIVAVIVEAARNVTIRFHAQKDTKAGDPLTLDIRLR